MNKKNNLSVSDNIIPKLYAIAKIKETTRINLAKTADKLRLKAEELEQSKTREEAIFASIGDGLISVNDDGNITHINATACTMLGLNQKEVLGKKLFGMVRLENEKGEIIIEKERPMTIALSGIATTTSGLKYYYVRNDKTKFPTAITSRPVRFKGKVIGAIEVIRDITKEIEVDRIKTEFVSLAAHQLRTPLSAIKWYSSMLLNGDAGELSIKQKDYVNEIEQGNNRMISLVNTLLTVTRIDMGTFIILPANIEIQKICDDVIHDLSLQISKKKLTLEKNYDKTLPPFKADPNYISIILQNLLTNAIKYTPENGKVIVDINKQEQNILISVKDNGCGIPKKSQPNIFTKLYRADNAVRLDSNGTGLGLYMVKSIVEQVVKGKIWFESEEDKGSAFYVELPLSGMIVKKGVQRLTWTS